jgi:hypothetical protein
MLSTITRGGMREVNLAAAGRLLAPGDYPR